MNYQEIEVLFNAIGEILFNQQKIMKHFGLVKSDWDDICDMNETERIGGECRSIANCHLRSVNYKEN